MRTDYYPDNRLWPWISSIFVDESARGRRVSHLLIRAAEEYARTCGFERVYIPSGMQGFYEKCGYRAIGTLVNCAGGADTVYAKDLDGGFVIRRARRGDAPALAGVQTASWRAAFGDIIPPDELLARTDEARVTAMYARLLDESYGNGYIGETGGAPHIIAWWGAARDAGMEGCAELICIHSLPDSWRRGTGTRMMERVLSDIRDAGCGQVVLWVFAQNARARAFYEKMGFSPTNKTKPAFGATEILYKMDL